MTFLNKYYDIVITDNNRFFIIELDLKTRSLENQLETLKKIERVLKEGIPYDKEAKLPLGLTTEYDTKKFLREVAQISLLVSKGTEFQKGLEQVCTRIDTCLFPSKIFPLLPLEITQKILNDVSAKTLISLRQVCRHGDRLGSKAIIERAKEFGFEGNNSLEAIKYLNELFHTISELCKNGFFEKFICAETSQKVSSWFNIAYNRVASYINSFGPPAPVIELQKESFPYIEGFDAEKTLQNLCRLTTEDLYSHFWDPKIYHRSLKNLSKYLLKLNLPVSEQNDFRIKTMGPQAVDFAFSAKAWDIFHVLIKHCTLGNPNHYLLKLTDEMLGKPDLPAFVPSMRTLFEQGATLSDNDLGCALCYAAIKGSKEAIQLFMEKGAKVNKWYDISGGSPLVSAIQAGNTLGVEYLLQNGADPNYRVDGRSPLTWALFYKQSEIVELLKEKGAVEFQARIL